MNSNKPFAPQRRIAFAITVLGVAGVIAMLRNYDEAGPEEPTFWVMMAIIVGIILLSTLLYCKLPTLPPRAQKAMRGYVAALVIVGVIELAYQIAKVGGLITNRSVLELLLNFGAVLMLDAIGCYIFLTGQALRPSDPGPKGW